MLREAIVLIGLWTLGVGTAPAQRGAVQPAPPGPPPIRFSGRVIADSIRQPDEIIEIRLEGASGERVAFAYTETSGQFEFRPVVLEPNRFYYLVVEYEGHRPYRERLDHITNINSGAQLTIFLQSESNEDAAPAPAGTVVDLGQLTAVIPEEAYDEYGLALEEIGQGLYASAIARLERVVELAPHFYEALNRLGGQYVRANRYRDAEQMLGRALELSPAATPPRVNLGVLHYQEGQGFKQSGNVDAAGSSFRRAVEILDEAIRNEPLNATAHYYAGAALYEAAEFGRAEQVLYRALDLDPTSDEARLVLVNLFARQGRFEEALAEIRAYLANHPDSPMRASLEQMTQQIESALDFLQRPDN